MNEVPQIAPVSDMHHRQREIFAMMDEAPVILAQRSISASPVGAPATIATMLDFCARHGIAPHTREFAMSEVNEALEVLEKESPAKRLVLRNPVS